MIEYLVILLILPFIPLQIMPLAMLLLFINAERRGVKYSPYEVASYLILPLIPSFVAGMEKYFLFLSYFLSIMLCIKLLSSTEARKRMNELKAIFGEKMANEILFVIFFMRVLKNKIKRMYIAHRLRGKFNVIKMIVSLSYSLGEKAKRIAISKAVREQ